MRRRGGSHEKLFLIAIAAGGMMSADASAQSTVVTTTGVGRSTVQIESEYRTRIRSYVTEHHVRPVVTQERIVVGSPVPHDVELEAVPSD
jgi:hypothetical protein